MRPAGTYVHDDAHAAPRPDTPAAPPLAVPLPPPALPAPAPPTEGRRRRGEVSDPQEA